MHASTSQVTARLVVFMAMAASTATAGPANISPLDVRARVDRQQITVGDIVTYTVEVTAPAGSTVTALDNSKAFAPFEVRDISQTHKSVAGKSVIAISYRLTVFEVGERTLGGVKVQCLLPGEKAPRKVTAPAVKVTVASVLPPDAQDIKDIRDPVPVKMTGREWLMIALALFVLALLAVTVLCLILRSRRRRPQVTFVPVEAHERALRELDILARSDLLPRGDVRGYYTRLSEIIREYLEARFGIPAMGETTWMIRHDLERASLPTQWRDGFVELLKAADLVKFAREDPSDQQAENALRDARQLVLISRAVSEHSAQGGEVAPAAD